MPRHLGALSSTPVLRLLVNLVIIRMVDSTIRIIHTYTMLSSSTTVVSPGYGLIQISCTYSIFPTSTSTYFTFYSINSMFNFRGEHTGIEKKTPRTICHAQSPSVTTCEDTSGAIWDVSGTHFPYLDIICGQQRRARCGWGGGVST